MLSSVGTCGLGGLRMGHVLDTHFDSKLLEADYPVPVVS